MAGSAVAGSALTVGRLVRAVGPLLVLAFLVNATIVAVSIQAFNVPATNDMLDFPVLLFASIGPVIGNAVGFLASYRRPNQFSLVGFLIPGAAITVAFAVLALVEYGDHDDVGILVASLLVTVAPTAVAVVGLLRRRAELVEGGVSAGPVPGGVSGGAVPGGVSGGGVPGGVSGGGVPGGVSPSGLPVTGSATHPVASGPPAAGVSQSGPPATGSATHPDGGEGVGEGGAGAEVAATGRWELAEDGTPRPVEPPAAAQPDVAATARWELAPDGSARPVDPPAPDPDEPTNPDEPDPLSRWRR